MPRKARERSSTKTYHVMVRGLNKMPVFSQEREKRRILNLIEENLEDYAVEIYAYCIMSNHLHLLVKAELEVLSSFMAKILAAYAQYYNFKHKRVGYVFQDRYRSQCVETEKYFWNCIRYIHLNPVKGKNFKDISAYVYSSMKEYYSKKYKIIHKNILEILAARFQSTAEFIDFHKMYGRDVFVDVEEDMKKQRYNIAKDMLREIIQEMDLPASEIFEYVKTRKIFEKRLKEVLKVSDKKISELLKELKMN